MSYSYGSSIIHLVRRITGFEETVRSDVLLIDLSRWLCNRSLEIALESQIKFSWDSKTCKILLSSLYKVHNRSIRCESKEQMETEAENNRLLNERLKSMSPQNGVFRPWNWHQSSCSIYLSGWGVFPQNQQQDSFIQWIFSPPLFLSNEFAILQFKLSVFISVWQEMQSVVNHDLIAFSFFSHSFTQTASLFHRAREQNPFKHTVHWSSSLLFKVKRPGILSFVYNSITCESEWTSKEWSGRNKTDRKMKNRKKKEEESNLILEKEKILSSLQLSKENRKERSGWSRKQLNPSDVTSRIPEMSSSFLAVVGQLYFSRNDTKMTSYNKGMIEGKWRKERDRLTFHVTCVSYRKKCLHSHHKETSRVRKTNNIIIGKKRQPWQDFLWLSFLLIQEVFGGENSEWIERADVSPEDQRTGNEKSVSGNEDRIQRWWRRWCSHFTLKSGRKKTLLAWEHFKIHWISYSQLYSCF